MNTYYSENVRYIVTIIFTLIFLVASTYLWKDLHKNYALAYDVLNNDTEVILMENIDICSDFESNNLLGYQFTINSNYDTNKNYNVKIISNHIKNEDIHYTIDDGEIMILNEDKIILNNNISSYGVHNYLFKVWLTNEYQDNSINVVIDFE